MRRTDLERKLIEMGWRSTGEASGMRHAVWRHPKKRHPIYVPTEDLILNSTAERLLGEAEG
jgi:hypothetical protein